MSTAESPDAASRRDRAAIAAQACQTCRTRKSKCDERRPKCGLCDRLGVECSYREPQATKKDKTLVHILSVLERVESKVDRIGHPLQADLKQPRSSPADRAFEQSPAGALAAWERLDAETRQQDTSQTFPPSDLISANSHLTAAHRVLVWPAIYLLLTNARVPATKDLHYIMQEGTPWFTHLELKKHPSPLPSHVSSQGPTNPSHPRNSFSLGFANLTAEVIHQLVDAFFRTFNVIHPILDRDYFYSDIIGPVVRGGYEDRDGPTCLIMLVLALGSIACDGAFGPPVTNSSTQASGFRGGSETNPPGLYFLNEARRRLGFTLHDCSLENVQIYILQAAYYEACARHMDYWRCCASASMAFQVYIRCERIDWTSAKADLIKRIYWTCILHEDLYHLELDLPRTGIYTLEDKIPLPSFQRARNLIDRSNDTSHFHYHFLAMVALRRLIARIHDSLHGDSQAEANNSENYAGPPIHLVKELGRQLESWRTFLPQSLQWADAEAHSYPSIHPRAREAPGPLFTPESLSPSTDAQTSPDSLSSFGSDIVTGHLRTRFYYARFMLYRPFIFKALHFPEAMTPEDDAYAALALRSACMWPLAMAPCRERKRLIPHLFTWTQNFLGILLLIKAADQSDYLRRICEERVSKRDLNLTVSLLLDWIRDLKSVDGMAEWSWSLIEPLFAGYRG